MAKDVIKVGGEERVVREDTAKSYRGTIWALTSVVLIIAVVLVMFFLGVFGTFLGGSGPESPAQIEQERR